MRKLFIGLASFIIVAIAFISALMSLQGRFSYNNNKNVHLDFNSVVTTISQVRIEIGGHEYNLVESLTDLIDVWTLMDTNFSWGAVKKYISSGGLEFTNNIGNNLFSVVQFIGMLFNFSIGLVLSILLAPIIMLCMIISTIFYVFVYALNGVIVLFSIVNGSFLIYT